jgi:predicted acyltransferase
MMLAVRSPEAPTRATRLSALDAFRGLAMMGMVLVNNQGSGAHAFWGLAHAKWNGWSGADLVFPAFLFIVGASMAMAFARPTPPSPAKIVRRAVLLFAIGLVLNGFPYGNLHELRTMGVLQRIGLAYLLAALLVLHRPRRTQVLIAVVALVGYWAVLMLPVPGHAAFHMAPSVNVPGHFDKTVLGPTHVYQNGNYDPEGLLSTIPAVVTVLIGYWAGAWLRVQRASAEVSRRLARVGAAAVVGGLAWGLVLPVNKRLWTSSFVVLTAGFSLLLLAGLYHVVEVRRHAARPLVVFGKNALIVFILSEELGYLMDRFGWRPWLYHHVFEHFSFSLGSLLYGLSMVALWWAVTWVLDRRRIYLRV